MNNIELIDIDKIKVSSINPRKIEGAKFDKLVKSIKDFPEMLNLRCIVVDENMDILGGNQRFLACKKAGLKEVPIIRAEDLTQDQKKEFMLKDNIHAGEFDLDLVTDMNIDLGTLNDFGFDFNIDVDLGGGSSSSEVVSENEVNPYTDKIKAPIYQIKGDKPEIESLVNYDKTNSLLDEIDNANISDPDICNFLKAAATRHQIFNYERIAEFYAHSTAEIQDLMERSALVIIDF